MPNSSLLESNGERIKKLLDDNKNKLMRIFSRGSEHTFPSPIKWNAHSAVWKWNFEGKTERVPDKLIKLKNWNKNIYYWKGATIVMNVSTLEVWVRTRTYTNPIRMIYKAWSRADLTAREFSTSAQIAIKPLLSEHPSDIHKAHIVLRTKKLNKYLKPQADKQTSERTGLHYDLSHPDLPEFIGQESVEGVFGADWVFLALPKEWQELKHAIAITQAKHDLTAKALNKVIELLRKKED